MKYSTWDSYFYPQTDILKNKLSVKVSSKLANAEHVVITYGLAKIARTKNIPLTSEGLIFIHKTLFDEIYEWAGEFRSINMQKQTPYGISLIYSNANEIDYQLKSFDAYIKENNFFKGLKNRDQILKLIVSIYSELQDIHPFREGNTRTTKIFINEFVKQYKYRFDFSEMTDSESMLIKFLLKPANESKTKIKELFDDAKNILSKYLFEYDPSKIDIFVKRPKDEDLYKKYKDKLYKLTTESKIKAQNKDNKNIIRNYYKSK